MQRNLVKLGKNVKIAREVKTRERGGAKCDVLIFDFYEVIKFFCHGVNEHKC